MTLSQRDLATLINSDTPEAVAGWFLGKLSSLACAGDENAAELSEAAKLYLASREITKPAVVVLEIAKASEVPEDPQDETPPLWRDGTLSYIDRARVWLSRHDLPAYRAHDFEKALGISREQAYGIIGSLCRQEELVRVSHGYYECGPHYQPGYTP